MKLLALGSAFAALANASTLKPPILPLIVRNPYLSTWLQDARVEPWTRWPMFYTGEQVSSMHHSHDELIYGRLASP